MIGQVAQDERKTQLLDLQRLQGDDPQRRPHAPALQIEVGTHPDHVRNSEGEIELLAILKALEERLGAQDILVVTITDQGGALCLAQQKVIAPGTGDDVIDYLMGVDC